MIVRILGEQQYVVPDDQRGSLEDLDSTLVEAVDSGDEERFGTALTALAAAVRQAGRPLADDDFTPSDLVVPFPDATLAETKNLLAESDGATGSAPEGG